MMIKPMMFENPAKIGIIAARTMSAPTPNNIVPGPRCLGPTGLARVVGVGDPACATEKPVSDFLAAAAESSARPTSGPRADIVIVSAIRVLARS